MTKIINRIRKNEEFKDILRSSGFDKSSGGADKLGILLPLLNPLPNVFSVLHGNHNKIRAATYLKLLFIPLLLILLVAPSFAAVPNVMNFQAKLTDSSNVLLTGTDAFNEVYL